MTRSASASSAGPNEAGAAGLSSELDDYEVPFKGIVEQSIAGIYILQDGRFKYVNETFSRMCGLKREELMGARLRDVANPEQADALVAQYERKIDGNTSNDHFIIRRTSQRRPGSFEIHGTRVMFHGQPAIVGVGIDITEREQQREELMRGRARLQELVVSANSVRENERNRVARELHDVIGGMLTAIKFDLSRLAWGIDRIGLPNTSEAAELQTSQTKALAAIARELIQLTQDTVEAVRGISEGLRPGSLDHLGLTDTLSQGLASFECRYGIATHLAKSGEPMYVDRNAAIGVYRIFQEALTNVARHSKATEVTVDLRWEEEGLALRIADNGLGFQADRPPYEGHLGLLGMQERARELGGIVEFGTGPKSGASILLRVPCAEKDEEHGDTQHDQTIAR